MADKEINAKEYSDNHVNHHQTHCKLTNVSSINWLAIGTLIGNNINDNKHKGIVIMLIIGTATMLAKKATNDIC